MCHFWLIIIEFRHTVLGFEAHLNLIPLVVCVYMYAHIRQLGCILNNTVRQMKIAS